MVEQPARRLRPLAVTFAVASVVSAGLGGVFGSMSSTARNRVLNPMLDGQGAVVGLTRAEAIHLDTQARTYAIVANTLFAGAASLALGAVILWLTSG